MASAKGRIGYGCGRLNGGSDRKASIALIETALAVGIRHFDVAPNYGFGAAEEVVGTVLSAIRTEVTIATKFGLPPPARFSLVSLARHLLKPAVDLAPALKDFLIKNMPTNRRSTFQSASNLRSVERSLKHLGTDYVDVLLLHEPHESDITDDLVLFMEELESEGFARSLGSSTGSGFTQLVPFGTVHQYHYSGPDDTSTLPLGKTFVHGLIRRSTAIQTDAPAQGIVRDLSNVLGADLLDETTIPALVLAASLWHHPNLIALISTKDRRRLQRTVDSTDYLFRSLMDVTDQCNASFLVGRLLSFFSTR